MHCIILFFGGGGAFKLACFFISKYPVFIWILGFQWLMQIQYIYLQDYGRPLSSCKAKEKWPHIALPCYNESEKEIFTWNS